MAQTIQDELNSIIKNFAENSIKQPQADDPFTPVLDATGNVIDTPAAAATPNAGTPAAANVEPPKPVAPPKSDDGLIEDWDTTAQGTPPPAQVAESTPATVTTPNFDFSYFAKELGREDIAKAEDVVNVVNELKTKAAMLESVPEDLSKAMEIAKNGGNYLEYLKVSVVDWSKEDPIILYENYIEDQFYDSTTNLVDYEKVDKILEKMDDEEKEFRGRELQKQYIAYQKQQRDFIEQQAIAQKTHFESTVRQVVNEIKDINGYVLSPAKKSELLEYVLSGQDLKENDVRSRVVNAFIKKNFQALDNYMKTKVRNSTQREILEEAQIPDIKPSTTPATAPSTKPYSLQDYIADLAKQKGF